jgi:predicted anti-sigma-YlaC factor YlaD
MSACSFIHLLQLVNKKLDLDAELEVYEHLDRCSICREAVAQLSRDQDESSIDLRPHAMKPSIRRRSTGAA